MIIVHAQSPNRVDRNVTHLVSCRKELYFIWLNLGNYILEKAAVSHYNQDGYEPDEFKATPAMTLAGASALSSYASIDAVSASLNLRDLSAEVYKAMEAARLRGLGRTD